jgi:hypothetical protein
MLQRFDVIVAVGVAVSPTVGALPSPVYSGSAVIQAIAPSSYPRTDRHALIVCKLVSKRLKL